MEQHHEKELKDIMSRVSCSRDFTCYKSEFKNLSEVGYIGLTSLILCLEKHAEQCQFSLTFGHHHLCKCAVRIYIADQLRQ